MSETPTTKKIWFYQFATLGFYFFLWCSRSRASIHKSARRTMIPSTWLLAVPCANYWWMWHYSQALEFVSYKRIKAADTFLLYIIATSGLLLFSYTGNVFVPDGSTDSSPDVSLLLILLVILVILLLAGIAGGAFFCSVMQNKINKLGTNQLQTHTT